MAVGVFDDDRPAAAGEAEAERIAEVLSPLAAEVELGRELELVSLLDRIATLIAEPAPGVPAEGLAATRGPR